MPTLLVQIKRRWLVLILALGLILALSPGPTDAVAVTALRDGALQLAAARRPADPQPWRMLGDLYLAVGQVDAALTAYDQALRRGDDSAALDASLARLHAAQGDDRRAVRYWARLLSRHPFERAARLALAESAIALADWSRAQRELEFLLAADPNDPVAHAWLGLLLIEPQPTAAIPHLEQAAQDPVWEAALKPVLAANRQAVASADPAYRSTLLGAALLGLDPSSLNAASPATFSRAATMLALRSLLLAVHRNPAYADAFAYLGQTLDRIGQTDWAAAAFAYALQLAPQSPIALTLAGSYWDRHARPDLARYLFEVAFDLDRENSALCLQIGATYLAQGEYTAAEAWLLFATELAPEDVQVWKTLAHFYLDTGIGAGQSGLFAARRWVELTPAAADAHDLLGWAYFLANQPAQAAASLTQALTLDPNLASAYYHWGRLQADQGRFDQAIRAYERAAALDTDRQLAANLERAWSALPEAYQDR